MNKQRIVELFSEMIEKNFGGSEREAIEIVKATNEEQRMAFFVVLEPQEGEYTTDLHSDTYTEEEVWKACNNFNTHSMKANIFHKVQTEKASIVQSYVTPAEFQIEDGRTVKKGSWVQWWHFPDDNDVSKALWDGVKSGEINGVSINGAAFVEQIKQEEES